MMFAKGLNKRLGKNAIVSILLKNVILIEHWREFYPNDFKLKRFKFVVDEIENTDGKYHLPVQHEDYGVIQFKILAKLARLDRPGSPNQYFFQESQVVTVRERYCYKKKFNGGY